MREIMCPICGKIIDDQNLDYLDNGSPACHTCVENERKVEEEKEKNT